MKPKPAFPDSQRIKTIINTNIFSNRSTEDVIKSSKNDIFYKQASKKKEDYKIKVPKSKLTNEDLSDFEANDDEFEPIMVENDSQSELLCSSPVMSK